MIHNILIITFRFSHPRICCLRIFNSANNFSLFFFVLILDLIFIANISFAFPVALASFVLAIPYNTYDLHLWCFAADYESGSSAINCGARPTAPVYFESKRPPRGSRESP